MNWPTVLENDDGIRPAGPSDECFYCQRKVGQPHGDECVIVKKRVKVRYTMEIEIDVPHFWDADKVEFHRNESSWCADNACDDIVAFVERSEKEGSSCLCNSFHCEFIGVVDDTPKRYTRD